MDPATIALLELGFSIAGKFFDRFTGQHASETVDRARELDQFVKTSVLELDQSIRSGIYSIIDKIETDNLERLISRARNLSALLDMGRPEQALQYAMTVRESVDYARNRLDENKAHWLGPYLAGSSIYFAALEAAGEHREADLVQFRADLNRMKVEVLDYVVPRMIERDVKVPWVAIADFVHGTTDRLPELLSHLEEFDQRNDMEPTAAVAPTAAVGPPLRVDTGIQGLITDILKPVDGVYLPPGIPERKLEGARRKVLPAAELGDQLLALIDLTVFGGARECVAVFSSYCIIGSSGPFRRYDYANLPAAITADGVYLVVAGERYFLLDKTKAISVSAFLNSARAQVLAR